MPQDDPKKVDAGEEAILNTVKDYFHAANGNKNYGIFTFSLLQRTILYDLNVAFKAGKVGPDQAMEIIENAFDKEIIAQGGEVSKDKKRDREVARKVQRTTNDVANEVSRHAGGQAGRVARETGNAVNQVIQGISDLGDRKERKLKEAQALNAPKSMDALEKAVNAAYAHPEQVKPFGGAEKKPVAGREKDDDDDVTPAKPSGSQTKPGTTTPAPVSQPAAQSGLPPTVVPNENMKKEEADFLNSLRDDMAVDGKLSGIVRATYDALKAEYEKPGKTGKKETLTIAAEVSTKMVTDVQSGKIPLTAAVDKKIDSVSKTKETPAHPSVEGDQIQKLLIKIHGEPVADGPNRGPLITSGKDKGKYAKPLDSAVKHAESTSDKRALKDATKELKKAQEELAELQGAIEGGIAKQFDWKKLEDRANKKGLPEQSESPLLTAVRDLANKEGVLDQKALQSMLTNPAFKAKAGLTGTVTVNAHNEADAAKDTLTINGQVLELSKLGLKLDDKVKEGSPVASAEEKAAMAAMKKVLQKNAGGDFTLSIDEAKKLYTDAAFKAAVQQLTGIDVISEIKMLNSDGDVVTKDKKGKVTSVAETKDALKLNGKEVLNLNDYGIKLDIVSAELTVPAPAATPGQVPGKASGGRAPKG